jgi:nuclear transport factor 2 (NTF2) superfamily protein
VNLTINLEGIMVLYRKWNFCQWRDADNPNQWMRTHGNEHCEFDDNGLMPIRDMSANDDLIKESERLYRMVHALV